MFEKVIKFLFVGGSVLMHFKYSLWFFLTLLIPALIENGESDGEIKLVSQFILVIGFILTALSLALTIHYERERKATRPVKNFPGHSNPPPPPAKTPVNFPTEPVFPDYPFENHLNDKA